MCYNTLMSNDNISRSTIIDLQMAALDTAEQLISAIPRDVKLLRVYSDMSQRELAAYLGVTQQCLAYWETGKCKPKLKHALCLMSAASELRKLLSN